MLALWTWFTNNRWAQWIALGIAAFLGVKAWEKSIEKGVRRQERDAAAREAAERQAEMVSTITENSNEYVRASERVRSHDFAERLPEQPGARLPPENYRD